MKKIIYSLLGLASILTNGFSQIENIERINIAVPNLPGYVTLKCDFHLHTIFSDGTVWPTVRVTEAWQQGYDAIAITDHIEGKPYRKHVPIDYNAPNEIAKNEGFIKDIIVIGGVEITRPMPPGHMNAIFIEDANKIVTERVRNRFENFKNKTGDWAFIDSIDRNHKDYLLALEAVAAQNGFVFWNHPGPPGKYDSLQIYPEHLDLVKKGLLHGIEVSGWGAYWPETFQWCLEHNLTLLSNSDYHYPDAISGPLSRSKRRNITLVFAKEKTEAGIKDALINRRTAVWVNDDVIGRAEQLEPLFYEAVTVSAPHYMDARRRKYARITNHSDFLIHLQYANGRTSGYFDDLILNPRSSQIIHFNPGEKSIEGEILNFHIGPKENLKVTLSPKP